MSRGKKRANGEGTIYQRADGRYEGAAFVLTTSGTRKRVRVYGSTYSDARKKLTKLIEQADQGVPVASENWTVEKYLDYWLEYVVRAERSAKTYTGYEVVVRRHLVPALGKRRLGKLGARDVRLFINRLRQECQCCKYGWDYRRHDPQCCAVGACCESQLSPRMVQFVHAVLRNALQNAVREELIPRNVAKLIRVPTPRYTANRGLTAEQARLVLDAAQDDRLRALYVLALFLGLRRGELLGLRWADVDLEAGTLEIAQALQRVRGELRFVRPKTRNSARTIPLPDVCRTALREHGKRQAGEVAEAGDEWHDSGLVFTTKVGTPIEPDNLRRSWEPLRRAAGLEGVRFHDIRHTCVTLLLNLGIAPNTVMEIVGHSHIGVTMEIYAHASLEEKRKALERLDGQLR